MDNTRDVAQAFQRGVREAQQWKWGPFWAATTEFPTGKCWNVGISVFNYALAIQWTEAFRQWP